MRHFAIFLLVSALTLVGVSVKAAKGTPASSVRGCTPAGSPIINVTQKVVNTVDSGEGGNYWAFDNLNRDIKVYDSGSGLFCAEVTYQGQFDSQAGQMSPGNTGILSGEEDGTFNGGYRGVVTGTLLTEPLWRTNGHIGTTDYNCDLSGNCPGAVNWIGQYFESGNSFNYEWWGWTYNYKNNVWVNSSDGNSGDII